jgi:hypothetical protein
MTRTLISALALVGAMTLSGGAMAQTMVGGASVSAEDLPTVQAACNTLAAKENSGTATNTNENTSGEGEDAETNTTDTGATTTSIDLDLLTYQACKDAGLVQ